MALTVSSRGGCARGRERERERERKKARELSGESEIERKLDLLSDPTCRNRCGCGRKGGRERRVLFFFFMSTRKAENFCQQQKVKVFKNIVEKQKKCWLVWKVRFRRCWFFAALTNFTFCDSNFCSTGFTEIARCFRDLKFFLTFDGRRRKVKYSSEKSAPVLLPLNLCDYEWIKYCWELFENEYRRLN